MKKELLKQQIETDPENAEDEECVNYQEESDDNDGENRNPKEVETVGILPTSFLIIKTMIASGLLNVSLQMKLGGIIPTFFIIIFVIIFTELSIHYLMRCKEISQRYSYALYSKLTMGTFGSLLIKLIMILDGTMTCCIYFKIYGELLNTILIIFFKDNGEFYFRNNFLSIIMAIILMPLMFKKDISSLVKYSHIGFICINIFFFSLIFLFFYKIYFKEISLFPFNKNLLFPSSESNFLDKIGILSGFIEYFSFQMITFPIYLNLKPRKSKSMKLATLLGSVGGGLIYYLTGLMGYLIYQDEINDNILIYIKKDILKYIVSKNKVITTVLIFSEISFFINVSFSSLFFFFGAKNSLLNLISWIKNKILKDKKDKDISGIELQNLDENKNITKKFDEENDNDCNDNKNDNNSYDKGQLIIIFIHYVIIIIITLFSKKLVVLENFVGAIFANYVNFIAPCLFFIILSRKKSFTFEKFFAIVIVIFGITLIFQYLFFNIKSLLT